MDAEKCAALLCTIETGSLTSAAEKLGYTPSGISRIMAAMEAEMGLPLLIRGHKGVLPTEACKVLLPYVRQMVLTGDNLRQAAQAVRGLHAGVVRIGCAYPYYCGYISQAIRDFQAKYPNVQIEFEEGNSSALMQKLLKNEINLCVISKRVGEFEWTLLKNDPMLICVPDREPFRSMERYPLKRVTEDPYIEYCPNDDTDVKRAFQSLNLVPNTRFSATTNFTAFQMVSAGLGVTLTNGIYAGDWPGEIRALPTVPAVEIPIGVAVLDQKFLSPAVRAFFPCLMKYLCG